MPDPQNFDVQSARQAGYSDDEIAAHLAQSRGFDMQSAQKNGYKTADIIDYLSKTPTSQAKPEYTSGSPEIDRVMKAGLSAQPQPQEQSFLQRLSSLPSAQMPNTAAGTFWDALKSVSGVKQLQSVHDVLSLGGQYADEAVHKLQSLGDKGVVSPEVSRAASFSGGVVRDTANLGAGLATPTGAAITVGSIIPATRIPTAVVAGGMSAKQIYDSQDKNLSPPDKLQQFLYGLSGMTMAAAIGGSGVNSVRASSAKPVSVADAASVIRDAVNPKSVIADKFQGNVADTLPDALKTAQQNGIDAGSRTGLAQSFQTLSDNLRGQMQNLLKPVASDTLNTGAIKGYSGETVGENTATYQQLFDRLGVINAELKPKFGKGGGAGAAAVKSEAELNTEANAIRSELYDKVGRANGMPAEDVADLHQRMGKSADVADIILQRASKVREQSNAEAQGQKLPKSGAEYFLQKMNQFKENTLGNPADRAIAKTVPNVNSDAPAGELKVLSDRPGKIIASYKINGRAIGQTSLTPFQDGYEVSTSQITKLMQNQGHGEGMYQQAAQLAKSKGGRFLYSDDQVSGQAGGVWRKLVSSGKAEFDPNSGRFRMALQ